MVLDDDDVDDVFVEVGVKLVHGVCVPLVDEVDDYGVDDKSMG